MTIRLYLWICCFILISKVSGFSQASFNLSYQSYQRHSEISWNFSQSNVEFFRILKADSSGTFVEVAKTTNQYQLVFTAATTLENYRIYVQALSGLNEPLANSDTIQIVERDMNDEELMDMVQRATFRYFWEDAHPISGMARERNTSGDIVTTGGTGFGIMAILSAVENEYITRKEGSDRLLKIVSFLQFADKFHGVFPHWINGNNGNVFPFGTYDNGGDLVETSFLMEGLLSARTFFDGDDTSEKSLRKIITGLWEAVEWDYYSKNNDGVLYWHWSPQYEWKINHQIRGYNEAMMVYLLAIASPTHPVPASYWKTGWAGGSYRNGLNYYGIKLPVGPAYGGPLFFAHYSFLGFDPRNLKDEFCNYFTQNTNHTLINRAYCIANPLKHKGYSSECWGLTASDDPGGYLAHEPGAARDNGTISPTAALSSMPYTPQESMDALRYFYFTEGEKLWGRNGFYDAFNPSRNWYATSYLAIDQGPIVGMIQNHRTGLLWKLFMSNPEISVALNKIGFQEDINSVANYQVDFFKIYPTLSNEGFRIKENDGSEINVRIMDGHGKLVQEIYPLQGELIGTQLSPGSYFVEIRFESQVSRQKFIKI